MQSPIGRWIIGLTITGMIVIVAYGMGEHRLWLSAKPQAMLWTQLVSPTPKNPNPLDAGKGIEAKLDQLLDAIKSVTLDALKVAYVQGAVQGALATALVFAILIAITRKGAS